MIGFGDTCGSSENWEVTSTLSIPLGLDVIIDANSLSYLAFVDHMKVQKGFSVRVFLEKIKSNSINE